jgi:hypothetical protein
MTDYRILVTGTREELTLEQEIMVRDAISFIVYNQKTPVIVVHGDCPTGVDAFVESVFGEKSSSTNTEPHPADWSQGRKAGPLRNRAMVALGADICLAFPKGESRGTRGCARMAREAGIPTIITEL